MQSIQRRQQIAQLRSISDKYKKVDTKLLNVYIETVQAIFEERVLLQYYHWVVHSMMI